MESIAYNIMEDQKTAFVGDMKPPISTENFPLQVESRNYTNGQEGVFSPLAPAFQGRGGNELLNLLAQQEPRTADTAPTSADMDDVMLNFRINNPEMFLDEMDHGSNNNYYMGGNRPESVASSNLWTDGSGPASGTRNGEMIDTFDFLVKSLSSANNYVSMLTREQLSVLRSIRPSLLYEFLQEVAKVRSDRRMRRALPNECAFCKNNGENEECYSTHALKDWRGRVLCPVLRAFRCPRCGATGERAHTIKYCPENAEQGSERSGNLSSRRRMPPSGSLMVNNAAANAQSMPPIGTRTPTSCPSTPAVNGPSPSPATSLHSLWSTFGIN